MVDPACAFETPSLSNRLRASPALSRWRFFPEAGPNAIIQVTYPFVLIPSAWRLPQPHRPLEISDEDLARVGALPDPY